MVTLTTGANVKNLTMDPRSGRVYAMNRGPGTISVIDPDTDVIDVVNTHANSVSVIDGRTNKAVQR